MRTYASHGTGRGWRLAAQPPVQSPGALLNPPPTYRGRALSRLLGVAACSVALLGCTDTSPGNDSDAGTNENTLDAGADAEAPPDAWTFDCPATQPDGHICLRGQVRRIVDDSPVAIPGGALIQRLVPAPGEDRPTVLQAEAEVRDDGRFIFPSVEVFLREDEAQEACARDTANNPDCYPCRYDHFDLVMPGDDVLMVGDGTGFHVPRNRYGVAQGRPQFDQPPHDPSIYVFPFFLVGRDTYDTWAEVWPGRLRQDVPTDPSCEQWCGLDQPFSSDTARLIIPLCYYYYPPFPWPLELPIDLLPATPEESPDIDAWISPVWVGTYDCQVYDVYSSRLDYGNPYCGPIDGTSSWRGMWLWWFDPSIEPTARLGFDCDFYSYCGYQPTAYATFSASDGLSDGRIVIVHAMAQ